MTDKPILFSAPMVRALLDGRKTQTRRVLKPRGKRPSLFEPGQWSDSYVLDPGNAEWVARDLPCRLGDWLWVREAWRTERTLDHIKPSLLPQNLPGRPLRIWHELDRDNCDQHGRYRHGRYMPRWASRLTLLVTNVRVQRLHDISEADARAEGLQRRMDWLPQYRGSDDLPWCSEFPRDAFRYLWDSINGPDAWDANPWVAAISFEVRRGNIDQQAP